MGKVVVFIFILGVISLQNSCFGAIDERIDCIVTYYNNVTFDGMSSNNIDNESHVASVYFDIDNKNKKIYNADGKLISEAIFTNDTISINWNSSKVPRVCVLLNKKDKTIEYKSFLKLPPKQIGNTRSYTPSSTIKTNGHGVCKYKKILRVLE